MGIHARLLWRNKLALMTITLGLMIFAYYYLFGFPVSLEQAFHRRYRKGTFCDGLFDYVLLQGAILQLSFIVGGVLYLLFIVPLSPSIVLRRVYPIIVVVVFALAFPLFFPLPTSAAAVLSSLVTMIPYYMTAFAVYFLYSVVEGRYLGFTQAIYW